MSKKETVIGGGETRPTGTPGVVAQDAVAKVSDVAVITNADLGDVLATLTKLGERIETLHTIQRHQIDVNSAHLDRIDTNEGAFAEIKARLDAMTTPSEPPPADAAPSRLDRIEAALATLISDPGALSADAGHLDRCRIALAADGDIVPIAAKAPGTNAPKRDTNSDAVLERRYAYHAPKGDQATRYAEIRAKVLETAKFIRDRTPASAEQTRAFNSLHDAMMLSNASIACNE